MKHAFWKRALLGLTPILLLLPVLATAGDRGERTLEGEYVWGRTDRGPLEAVFTPTGKNRWDVAFHFTFSRQPHVYEGKATGSLGAGELEGEVKNESRRRTFTFRGSFEDGVFSGTHAEVKRGREVRTGTLTLAE